MRTLPKIETIWNTPGPYIGTRKPSTRVTVQMPWSGSKDFLLYTREGLGTGRRRNINGRWFQDQANSHTYKELPNIEQISIDRTVDQDAGSFTIQMSNQWMYANGEAPPNARLGQPGYFTPTRGNSMTARARWNHSSNEWNDVLVPNAVLRVYTGYGGGEEYFPSIESAVAAGNLALYGIFLIDEVRVSTDGKINLSGRDMAKLLIDQQLFPPLVPPGRYPLKYERWHLENKKVRAAKKTITTTTVTAGVTPGEKRIVYRDSTVDRWYGSNASIYGHRATDSLDGNQHSYALSVGNSGPDKPFATNWWEYDCGEAMNAVYMHPWAGGYIMYVSVMEGGQWVPHPAPGGDGGMVPYDAAHLFATQRPAVDTGARIPYVAAFEIPHETSGDYVLPRVYQAERVRVSFRRLFNSGLGTWKYRAGIREVRFKGIQNIAAGFGTSSSTSTSVTYDPWVAAAGAMRVPGKPWIKGYLTVTNFDQVDVFGDMRRYPAHSDVELETPTGVRITQSGKGYYIIDAYGRVRTHGDAVHYGDPFTDGFVAGDDGYTWDMALTHTGKGYWILNTLGTTWAYGDAPDLGTNVNATAENPVNSIEAHPRAYGYWILRNDGKVFSFGDAQFWGSFPPLDQSFSPNPSNPFMNVPQRATCLRCNADGDGYWILTSNGGLGFFGHATPLGIDGKVEGPERVDHSRNIFTESFWEILPAPDDTGLMLMRANGRMYPVAVNDWNFGGPVPGSVAQLRSDGEYTDYTDIARDLAIWSGFLFYNPSHPSTEAAPVYGSLETTGAWSDQKLPDDIFDKRPVIDALTQIREAVGYLCWVDSEGRFRWESPNWWSVGNFREDGVHVQKLPEIDERKQLTDYTVSTADGPVRSSIIISSYDPYQDVPDTITHSYTPPSKPMLRGLIKPAMWVNDFFQNPDEQEIMAELIGLHISFQERIGQVTCLATPHIEINDQVRLYERQTEEVFIHYVRGISFNHNLETGEYMMTLTTHWLAAGDDTGNIVGGEVFGASPKLQDRIAGQQYGKLKKDPGGRL